MDFQSICVKYNYLHVFWLGLWRHFDHLFIFLGIKEIIEIVSRDLMLVDLLFTAGVMLVNAASTVKS